jgi:hypothetical protein
LTAYVGTPTQGLVVAGVVANVALAANVGVVTWVVSGTVGAVVSTAWPGSAGTPVTPTQIVNAKWSSGRVATGAWSSGNPIAGKWSV